ncbi:MAG: DUF2442 domain-containing protein [Sulfurovum sp.]|nr:DUF2442 domain-containing protein [Sulfurovum sp.]
MSTSTQTAKIEHLVFDDKIYVHLDSGDTLAIPYTYTERLAKADRDAIEKYRLIGGGVGVYFPKIDEDISLQGIIAYKMQHELMAS